MRDSSQSDRPRSEFERERSEKPGMGRRFTLARNEWVARAFFSALCARLVRMRRKSAWARSAPARRRLFFLRQVSADGGMGAFRAERRRYAGSARRAGGAKGCVSGLSESKNAGWAKKTEGMGSESAARRSGWRAGRARGKKTRQGLEPDFRLSSARSQDLLCEARPSAPLSSRGIRRLPSACPHRTQSR